MSYELASVNSDEARTDGSEGPNIILQIALTIKKEDWDAAVGNAANAEALIDWINSQIPA